MFRRTMPLVVAALLAFGAVACSGDAKPKPSIGEVSAALGELGVPDSLSECIAGEIHGELSASVLNRLVDDGIDAEGTDVELDEVTETVQAATTTCMEGADPADLVGE